MKTIKKVLLIAKYSFKEIIKSKILYSTLIIGLGLIVTTFVATEFTYGVPEKVALDFGLGMLSLSSLGISLFMGATLMTKELDSRTVYMVISRPIPRWAFIVGKILGLFGVLCLNVFILSIMTLAASHVLGGEINQAILIAIVFNLLECLMLILVVVFFSMFSNSILSALISLTILLLGHAVQETQNISFVQSRPVLKGMLEFYHLILPGFYKLNFKDFAIYQKSIDPSYIFWAFSYGSFYSLFLLLAIIYIFSKKNLD